MRGLLAVIILDLKRLWVDRMRLISSLIQPLLYLFVLGSGLGASSTPGRRQLPAVHLPGRVALSLLFTSVFAAILIVFDRQMGFLKAVLVAPVPRPAIAIGKVLSRRHPGTGAGGTIMLLFMPLSADTGLLAFFGVRGAAALRRHHLLGPGCGGGGALQVHDRVPHHLQRHAAAHVLPVGRALSLERAPHWLQIAPMRTRWPTPWT